VKACLEDGLSSTPTDAGSSSLSACADKCAQKGGNAVVSATTNALLTCMTQAADGGLQLCSQACFGGQTQ
jgi:hypothetical protein